MVIKVRLIGRHALEWLVCLLRSLNPPRKLLKILHRKNGGRAAKREWKRRERLRNVFKQKKTNERKGKEKRALKRESEMFEKVKSVHNERELGK